MEHNGTYFSSAKAKAEQSTTVSRLFLMTTRTYPSFSFTENSITSIVLSQEDVLAALQNLNLTKSQGPDNSPPMIMKECANELAPSLCMLLKEFIALGKLPLDWKTANITPVFKKGDKSLIAIYRQISLLDTTVHSEQAL